MYALAEFAEPVKSAAGGRSGGVQILRTDERDREYKEFAVQPQPDVAEEYLGFAGELQVPGKARGFQMLAHDEICPQAVPDDPTNGKALAFLAKKSEQILVGKLRNEFRVFRCKDPLNCGRS